jgi:hypothetical protein
MFSHLVGNLGFGWTLRIMAFACLFLLVIAVFVLKSRFPPNSRKVSRSDLFEPVRALRENPAYRWLVISVFFGFWG